MDTQLLTLSKIFTERLFRIPDYQRGYAWTIKQLKDFWTDIEQLEIGHNHYTGVLTLENVPENKYRQWEDDFWIIDAKNFQPFYIVDGQQRLTTSIILIHVILENLHNNEKLNYTQKSDIQRKFIFDSKNDGISRSYIFGYEKDNPSYEFLKTKIFLEKSSTRRSINDCWKAIYHNLGKNKERPLDDDNFLYTHYLTYFGKSLLDTTPYLDPRHRHIYRDDYAQVLLEKRFIPKNVSKDALPDERITLSDIYKYVSSLQDSVETWYKMYNPSDSEYPIGNRIWLDKLNRVGFFGFHPLVLVFLQRISNENIRLEFFQALEKLIFILLISERSFGYARRTLNKYFLQSIELNNDKLDGEKIIHSIRETTSTILKTTGFIFEVSSYFRSAGYYDWPGIRYLLFEYNLFLQSKSKTDRPKIFWPEFAEEKADFISIEHIFPLRARHDYWQTRFVGFTQKQRTSLRNSLGNLLPLSKPKNASLSNRPFPEKVNGFKEDSVVCYRYGSYAENEVAKIEDWNPKEILKRGLKLLTFMEKRWGFEIGNDTQKKIMLGLEFLDY